MITAVWEDPEPPRLIVTFEYDRWAHNGSRLQVALNEQQAKALFRALEEKFARTQVPRRS